MNKRKQIITRCIAILMLSGIVLLGGYVLYVSFRDIDKPVPMVTKTDSIGRPFEINGYMFYLRNDTLYDEKGDMITSLSNEYKSANNNAHYSSLKDVLNEAFCGEKGDSVDYSIFGYSEDEALKLYIQSVINSLKSGKTIEVSRWVTSGDWSHDDD